MKFSALKLVGKRIRDKVIVSCSLLITVVSILLLLSACRSNGGHYDATGIFEATEVIVSAKGNGEIIVLDLQEGEDVEVNAPLGYIDTTQLYLKKEQLIAAKKTIVSRYVNVNQQVASLRKQIETAEKEQQRFENLLRSDAGTQKQLDDINSQVEVLQKQLAAQLEQLNNSNNTLSGESEGIDIQIVQVEDQIKKSVISTPINGTILTKYAEQGEFTVQGKPLFKVADIVNLNLRVYITADQLTTLKIGQQVKVFADQGNSDRKEYSGRVIWISEKAEFTPKTIQTRNERANLVYAVKIAVKNDGYIKRGMYGEVIF